MTTEHSERGATALLVAGSLLFLLGMAALAVDVSGFYQTARQDQTIADLSCLAGVVELPDDPALAIDKAASVTKLNWPTMQYATVTTLSATTARMGDGAGNEVRFDAAYGGDNTTMRVEVTATDPTTFGKVLGRSSVSVGQVATCQRELQNGIYPTMPIGVLPGGFDGGLYGTNPCGGSSGNCGSLSVPRSGGGGVAANIANTLDRHLVASLGAGSSAIDCSSVVPGEQCSIVATDTGVSAGQIGNGFRGLLDDISGSTCTMVVKGDTLDCDSPSQVLGGIPLPMGVANPIKPAWWDTSLYGSYPQSPLVHFYWNGPIAKCDSPRLGVVPIVSSDLDWDLGDPNPGWPSGHHDIKVVGALDIILIDPNQPGDFTGGGNLKDASAIVMWYGPNTTCNGRPYGVNNGGNRQVTPKVKLIAD